MEKAVWRTRYQNHHNSQQWLNAAVLRRIDRGGRGTSKDPGDKYRALAYPSWFDDIENNDEPALGSKRRRANEKSPAIASQKTSQLEAQARECFRFTAIMDVAPLDPHWGLGIEANCPLYEGHVQTLVEIFKVKGIRRYDPETRLRVSVPR
ncbi:hypothetical protein DTO021D3_1984 [Paecilomyces variotii]|nr:hypothetical protein DTO032I3_8796 [Paecilomyces variotii]KAJ9281325.1 hypothetical protein DTO021D3_1984 [Paecilomyces variotii]KAJ9344989.1 hypothetical protein DTO027B6_2695 [Paecilomyces variotii]KAJ9375517.1 hypothetical protein DTO032I4_9007 [Paecilomyces variotii]